MGSSILNWSTVLKKEFDPSNQWPDVNTRRLTCSPKKPHSSMSAAKSSSKSVSLENTIKSIENLQIGEYNRTNDTRTRQEILLERTRRKELRQQERAALIYQQKRIERTAPKSKKIQFINRQQMDQIIQSASIKDVPSPSHNITNQHRRAKRKRFRNFEICLADLLQEPLKKPAKEAKHSRLKNKPVSVSIKRHRGKKRECPKKKWISRLKRSILLSRKLRQRQQSQTTDKTDIKELPVATVRSTLNPDAPDFNPRSATSIGIKQKSIELVGATQGEPSESEPHSAGAKGEIEFTRKFRSYCNNFITSDLCHLTETLLRDIFRFQARAYEKNQIKARATKRFVVGFKETQRQLAIRKVKLLLIAPDLEKTDNVDGGIADTVSDLKTKCDDWDVPYVFASDRWKIGRILLKKVPVSCVAILSYSGAEETAQQLMAMVVSERDRFLTMSRKS